MRILLFIACTSLLGAWLQPSHFLPWISWHSEVLAFLAALVLGARAVIGSGKDKSAVLALPWAAFPILGLCCLVALQLGTGLIVFQGDGLVLLFYLALCLIVLTVRMDAFAVDALALILLSASVCSVLLALVQTLDLWDSASWIVRPPVLRRPGANLGQPNHLGTLLLMGLASLIFLYNNRRLSAMLSVALTGILLWGVGITESRAAIVGLVLMAVWLQVGRQRAGLRLPIWVGGITLVVLFIILWGWPQILSVQQEGVWTSDVSAQRINTSAGTRLVVWPQLLEAIMQKPWFGWGLLGVSKAHNAVLHAYPVGEPFTYAHNIILDMAVGVGVPMTVALSALACCWVYRRVCATRALLPWYCIAILLPFAVHSMLEFPFAYAYFLLPAVLAVAALEQSVAPTQSFCVPRGLAVGFLSVVTVLMSWSVFEYLKIEEDFRVIRFEAKRIGNTPDGYERPHVILLTQLGAALEASRLEPQPGMTQQQLDLARNVALRFPWTATQNRYALALALNGQPEEARRQLRVMHAMHGELTHGQLMNYWKELAKGKYPQLQDFAVP